MAGGFIDVFRKLWGWKSAPESVYDPTVQEILSVEALEHNISVTTIRSRVQEVEPVTRVFEVK